MGTKRLYEFQKWKKVKFTQKYSSSEHGAEWRPAWAWPAVGVNVFAFVGFCPARGASDVGPEKPAGTWKSERMGRETGGNWATGNGERATGAEALMVAPRERRFRECRSPPCNRSNAGTAGVAWRSKWNEQVLDERAKKSRYRRNFWVFLQFHRFSSSYNGP